MSTLEEYIKGSDLTRASRVLQKLGGQAEATKQAGNCYYYTMKNANMTTYMTT